MKARRRLETARLRIAREAARIMAEQGLDDFRLAKQKAAARLGNPDSRQMPGNAEIQEALVEYQGLFLGEAHTQRLRQLRRSALEAMRLFEPFAPRLVGPVLEGSAGHDTVISLHLFADPAEEVALFLMERNIPNQSGSVSLRYPNDVTRIYPSHRFHAGDVRVELTVFPGDGKRLAPLSPVDGKPMARAKPQAVAALLESSRG